MHNSDLYKTISITQYYQNISKSMILRLQIMPVSVLDVMYIIKLE